MADRLSSLPDDILHSILRNLPLKHAVRTSALSRQWAPQWICAVAASPVLDFTDQDFARGQTPARAAATVGRCLRLHAEHGVQLDALRVALVPPLGPTAGYDAFGRDVIGWIAAAVSRGAREVEVDLMPPPSQEDHGGAAFLELPADLFQARNSVQRLTLGRLSLRAMPLSAAGLASLRSISLSHTDITDEAVRGILANCGVLESLSLRCCPLLAAVSVASERLRVLELLGCRAVRNLRVAAPALESFTLYGDVILSAADWYESVAVEFIGDAPALRDVYLSHMGSCYDLDDVNHDDYYPLLYHIPPHSRVMTLCSVGLVVPRESQEPWEDHRFDHLVYAHIYGGGGGGDDDDSDTYIDMANLHELQLLLGSLQEQGDNNPRWPERVYYFFEATSLPVLQRLFIRLSTDPVSPEIPGTDDEDDSSIGLCSRTVLGRLTLIKVVNFRGTWRERRLVGFLLKRAPVLEHLVLVTVEGEGDKQAEDIRRWASTLEKASREARITVCRPSEDDSPNHPHTRFFHEDFCCMHQE